MTRKDPTSPKRGSNPGVHVIVTWICGLGGIAGVISTGLALEPSPARLCAAGAGAVALLLASLAAKARSKEFVDHARIPSKTGPRSWSVTWQMVLILAVPAICAGFALSLTAEQIVSRAALDRRISCYRDLAEAVLVDDSAAIPDRLADPILAMTGFEQAAPFAYIPSRDTAYGMDERSVSALKKALSRSRGGDLYLEDRGFGVVWKEVGDRAGLVGIRFGLSDHSGSWMIVVATVLMAVFGGGLLAVLGSADFKRWTASLRDLVEAIPGGKKPGSNKGLPVEMRAVDRELVRLEERFLSMPTAQLAAIETGQHAQEMKAHFFAGMSHDLRSPLNSVIGFTDLLLKGMDGPLNGEQKNAVVFIARESEKLLVLIGDILDTSKISAGRFELESSWIPSVEILTECEAAARRLVGDRPIELVSEFQPGLPPVFIDKDRIRQALVSVLSRAIDAMKRGTIRLKASRFTGEEDGKRWLKVEVIDAEQAIDAAELARIKKAFDQTGALPSKSGTEGLSLGIALASDIVDLHKGKLSVAGEEGFHAVFTVILPLDEP